MEFDTFQPKSLLSPTIQEFLKKKTQTTRANMTERSKEKVDLGPPLDQEVKEPSEHKHHPAPTLPSKPDEPDSEVKQPSGTLLPGHEVRAGQKARI